jgi:hypothetical protein
MLIAEARQRIEQDAARGGEGGRQLINYYVGQSVGMLDEVKPAAEVLRALNEECQAVLRRLGQAADE